MRLSQTSRKAIPAVLMAAAFAVPATGDVVLEGANAPVAGGPGCTFCIDQTFGETSPGGTNLFHGFTQFDIDPGESAVFFMEPEVLNVVARIGGARSSIAGDLGMRVAGSGALSDASLFLLNPNGVLFSGDVGLDVAGSLYVSSGAALVFEDGVPGWGLISSPRVDIASSSRTSS